MSDKGQRIYKWIVWILLIGVTFFSCYGGINNLMNPDITKTEWMKLLESKINRDYEDGYGDDLVTGKDIAISSMKALGNERLEYLIEGEITDESLIELADEIDIVKKRNLKDTYSEKEADEVLSKLLNYYSNPNVYPVYDKTQYSENVVDTSGWKITRENNKTNVFILSTNGGKPETGKILLIENEYGISVARKVLTCENGDAENEYKVTLEKITSASEVASHFSFSGYADFSYLDNFKVDNQQKASVINETNNFDNTMSSLLSIEPMTVYAVEFQESTRETDIEFGISVKRTKEDNEMINSVDVTVKKDGVELDLELPISEGKSVGADKEVSLTGTLKIENLSVVASGEWNPLDFYDKNNNVSVTVNGNVVSDIVVSGEITGEIELPVIPVPISVGPGCSVFSIELQPLLVVGLGGEVKVEWRINNIRKGIEYVPANNNPLIWIDESDDVEIDFQASVHVKFGIEIEADAYILKDVNAPVVGDCTIKLADPSIEIMGKLSAETQDINPGFEGYLPCLDVKLRFPLIKINAASSFDEIDEEEMSALATVLRKLKVNASLEITTEDSPIIKREDLHIEFEQDGTINTIVGLGEDVCTHVIKEEEDITVDDEEIDDDTIDDVIDDMEEELRRKIEEILREIIQDFLIDNCHC